MYGMNDNLADVFAEVSAAEIESATILLARYQVISDRLRYKVATSCQAFMNANGCEPNVMYVSVDLLKDMTPYGAVVGKYMGMLIELDTALAGYACRLDRRRL